jgi:hypothetical protein
MVMQTVTMTTRNVMSNCLFLGAAAEIMQTRMGNMRMVTNGESEAVMEEEASAYSITLNLYLFQGSDFHTVKCSQRSVHIIWDSEGKYQLCS